MPYFLNYRPPTYYTENSSNKLELKNSSITLKFHIFQIITIYHGESGFEHFSITTDGKQQ